MITFQSKTSLLKQSAGRYAKKGNSGVVWGGSGEVWVRFCAYLPALCLKSEVFDWKVCIFVSTKCIPSNRKRHFGSKVLEGMPKKGSLGRLWGGTGEELGRLWGGFGGLWGALGRLWGGFGGPWEALERLWGGKMARCATTND